MSAAMGQTGASSGAWRARLRTNTRSTSMEASIPTTSIPTAARHNDSRPVPAPISKHGPAGREGFFGEEDDVFEVVAGVTVV